MRILVNSIIILTQIPAINGFYYILAGVLLLCVWQNATAQSTTPENKPQKKEAAQADSLTKEHSPGKAARMSAFLPGLGQAYNRKYWKIPIVYAALGVSTYYIIKNNNKYQKYRDAYTTRTDNDSTTTTNLKYTTKNLKLRRDFYRRNLELSIIITAGIYVLNIVDAAVDAYLYYFDVSDDLSMRIQPEVNAFSPGNFRGGVKLSLFF